jgi:predicted transcriptional regulator|tara:strand:- start:348 stop:533 length:186 start_codon:yes stop_codon:yes gene_type:complete
MHDIEDKIITLLKDEEMTKVKIVKAIDASNAHIVSTLRKLKIDGKIVAGSDGSKLTYKLNK